MESLCSFLLTHVAQAGIDPVTTLNTTRRETLKCETVSSDSFIVIVFI